MSGDKALSTDKALPAGWRLVRLGEVCDVVTGNTPPRGETRFYGGDIPWVKPEDLDREMYVQASAEYLSDEGAKVARLLPQGSVLVSCIGKIGKTALAGCQLATNQQLNALVPHDEIDPIFLYYSCQSVRPALEVAACQALVPILNKSDFASFQIPLPPLPEQRRIAAILKEQMAAVEKARAAAEAQLKAAKALPAAYLREVFPAPGAMLPDGWRLVKMGEVCSFVRGVSFDKSEVSSQPQDGLLPILRAGNIGDGLDLEHDLIWVPEERVSPEQKLLSGDMAVCMSSGSASVVGKTAQLSSSWNGSVGAFCGIIRPRREETADYLGYWLRSEGFRSWRDGQARGANIQNLRFSQFEEIELPFPPLPEQRRIAGILKEQMAAVENGKASIEFQLAEINALPSALLRQAFSGEL